MCALIVLIKRFLNFWNTLNSGANHVHCMTTCSETERQFLAIRSFGTFPVLWSYTCAWVNTLDKKKRKKKKRKKKKKKYLDLTGQARAVFSHQKFWHVSRFLTVHLRVSEHAGKQQKTKQNNNNKNNNNNKQTHKTRLLVWLDWQQQFLAIRSSGTFPVPRSYICTRALHAWIRKGKKKKKGLLVWLDWDEAQSVHVESTTKGVN